MSHPFSASWLARRRHPVTFTRSMTAKKRIGILNSGGDCPGLNAVIHGVVGAASQLGWEVVGFKDGFEGLLGPERFMMLDPSRTQGIVKLGGTILGTVNKGHFVSIIGKDEQARVPQPIMDKAKATLSYLGISALVVVGGDGSLSTALQLQEEGFPVVGVPKTIDNDLDATAMTFGFDSAVHSVVDGLDRLNTTADSHKRIMILEVMGRHAGWIAAYGGIAGGADIILIPEIPFCYDRVIEILCERERTGHKSTLIVVAEGAAAKDGAIVAKAREGQQVHLGGVGHQVQVELEKRLEQFSIVRNELDGTVQVMRKEQVKPTDIEMAEPFDKEIRTCVLGHLQRGGAPTALDRILGVRFGVRAVQLIKEKKYGHMVSYKGYHVGDVTIKEAVAKIRLVEPDGEVVQAARGIGISFGEPCSTGKASV
jgi:ATP-dependent phosphofructokinase / diphosphate-dependent phosphofructokinase